MKLPTLYNSHPDKLILESMITMMQARIQPLILYKVRAHAHIDGNEQADQLAKAGKSKPHRGPIYPYENGHSTPYYLHKDEWHSME